MMTLFLNLLLALLWASMIGEFTPFNILFGFALGYFFLRIAWNRGSRTNGYFSKFVQIISFVLYFLWELVVANLRVAKQTLSPLRALNPGVLAINLEPMSDAEITLLANLITLTPGTLSLDVSADRSTLFVHFMHIDNAEDQRQEIKEGFERRVLEVMR
ncbi:MAG: Na+/H+ antiporter subunit E [Planctomycetota bacterium]